MIKNGCIALIGETGAGKTVQAGELAKAVYKETGLKTCLFSNERGGLDPIIHLTDIDDGLGIIHAVRWDFQSDPFVFMNHAVMGEELEIPGHDNIPPVWRKLDRSQYGLWLFDSGTMSSEEAMNKLSSEATEGKNIGGKPSYNIELGDSEGKVASNTQTHYGAVQTFMKNKIFTSQLLPGLVLWTFRLDVAEDSTRGQMAGPALAGHALTTHLPAWFRYTLRIRLEPVIGSKPRHILELQTHTDGRLGGYANARVPLASYDQLDLSIEPASIVQALDQIERIRNEAKERDRLELGL